MADFFKTIGDVVKTTFVKECTFYNDTDYEVVVVDHDGTRTLHPGCSEGNYLVTGFSVSLVLKLPGREERKPFPSSQYDNRTHAMSEVFRDEIEDFKARQKVSPSAASRKCINAARANELGTVSWLEGCPVSEQDYTSYLSSLPDSAFPFLERELDWNCDGVEKDQSEIAEHMLGWDEKLSTHLELTHIDIHDIKQMYPNQPVLQRYVCSLSEDPLYLLLY